jgi:membrane protease YdiL (CAAX protease family)
LLLVRVKIPEMLAVEKTPVRQIWGAWPTLGFGLVIGSVALVVELLTVFAIMVFLGVANRVTDIDSLVKELMQNIGLALAVSCVTTAVIAGGFMIIIIKVRRGASVAEYLALKKVSRRAIIIPLIAVIGLIIIGDLAGYFLEGTVEDEFMLNIYETSGWPVLLWIGLVVFTPLLEEGFFRGFLFTGLIGSRLGVTGTILFSTAVWTALHVQYGYYGLSIIFVSGILLGIVRYRTGSLFPPLLMHAVFNAVALSEIAVNFNRLVA